MAIFKSAIRCFLLFATYRDCFDSIGPFLLRFIVGPYQQFHYDPDGEELDPRKDEHQSKDQQWPVPDILTGKFNGQ